ncbi:MAG: hypothetical protein ACTSVV_18700 [Promethearchaeota archaeon]
MFFNEIIATKIDEVGVSWFDFYSIGHITFGVGTFLFFSLLYTIPKLKDKKPILPWWGVIALTIAILIIWEIIENTLFIALGLKFEGRADSPQNTATDIILGILGMLGAFISAYYIIDKDKNIWGYYIFGIISFIIWLIFFFIGRYITFWYNGLYA